MQATIVNCGCWTIQFNPSSVETCQHWRFLYMVVHWHILNFLSGAHYLACFANFWPGFRILITILPDFVKAKTPLHHSVPGDTWHGVLKWCLHPSPAVSVTKLLICPRHQHPPTCHLWEIHLGKRQCGHVLELSIRLFHYSEKAPTRAFLRILPDTLG